MRAQVSPGYPRGMQLGAPAVLSLALVCACGGDDASAVDDAGAARRDGALDAAPVTDARIDGGGSIADRLAALETARAEAWSGVFRRTSFGIENEWEVVYDGNGVASENV